MRVAIRPSARTMPANVAGWATYSVGFAPLVVDVLNAEPQVDPRSRSDQLTLRTWRMQRDALKVELGTMGVAVLDWDGDAELTGGLLHAMRASRPGSRAWQ